MLDYLYICKYIISYVNCQYDLFYNHSFVPFYALLVSEHSSMIWFYHTFMLFRFLIIICSPKASLNSIVKYNLFLVTLNVYGFAFNSFISYAVYSFIASSPILILLYQMPLFLEILMCPFLLIYCL